jgi:hypothetical protein
VPQILTPQLRATINILMSQRLDFDTVCPNNHNQTLTFNQEEFEKELKSGALVFHCNTCGADWPPSSEEIAKFRRQLSRDSS